jgi:hypothetical protein
MPFLNFQEKMAYIEKLRIYEKNVSEKEQKKLLAKKQNKLTKKQKKIIPNQIILIESDTENDARTVNNINTKVKPVQNASKKKKPILEGIEKQNNSSKKPAAMEITSVDEHLLQKRQRGIVTNNFENSDDPPSKQTKLLDNIFGPLQRPPK